MKKTYKIKVDCANCALKMEDVAKRTEGVKDASIDYIGKKITVDFIEGVSALSVMRDVLANCKRVEEDAEIYFSDNEEHKKVNTVLLRIIISSVLTVGAYFIPVNGLYKLLLFVLPYLVVGYDILIKAVKGVLNKQVLDENFLMAVASIGAFIVGYFRTGDYVEAVIVILLYQLGEYFQSRAVDKSRKNISALMDIRPDYANKVVDNKVIKVNPEKIEVGETIAILPGEKVPIDGVVIGGSCTLDLSALTGESLPLGVKVGDEVLSGAINLDGFLKIKTVRPFGESTLSKILDLVENASSKKSRSEKFITRFAKYYTPIVCAVSLCVALLIPLFRIVFLGLGGEFLEWIYRALTFLVISCPCALVISVPLSFFAGIGGASRKGILIKGSDTLETLSKIESVVFDKTGTLTKGVFEVANIIYYGNDREEFIERCAIVESFSSHPIAKRIASLYNKKVDESRVSNLTEIAGEGITAIIDGVSISLGNEKIVKRSNSQYSPYQGVGTPIYAVIDGRVEGIFILSDTIKEGSRQAIVDLKAASVKNTVILTGDEAKTAREVACLLRVDKVHFSLLPQDKVAKMEELLASKTKGKALAFVGDGINDAPVLARADVGISMGALGSDAAIEASDVVIMDDDPKKVATAIKISKKCMRVVAENVIFALGMKVLCMVLGVLGIGGITLAVFADVGVMILAVLNAMRVMINK